MTRHFLFLLGPLLSCGGLPAQADQVSLDDIKAMYAPEGVLQLRGQDENGYSRAWACPSFALARAVVALLQPGEEPKAKTIAFADIRRKAGCTAAKGRYQVIDAAPEAAMINWGYEAEEYWQALQARDAGGRDLGLVFDASPYAP